MDKVCWAYETLVQRWPTLPIPAQQVNALEFVPGTSHLAVAGFANVKLFDVASQSTEPVREPLPLNLASPHLATPADRKV